MSIYTSIVSAISNKHSEFESFLEHSDKSSQRDKFCYAIYEKCSVNHLFWKFSKTIFIGSTDSFKNIHLNDPTNYPFKGEPISQNGHSYQEVGEKGEEICLNLLDSSIHNDLLCEFFDRTNTFYKHNEAKISWHDCGIEKRIEPYSIDDYQLLFTATPDALGVSNHLKNIQSYNYFLDVLVNNKYMNSVVEIKTSLKDDIGICNVRDKLFAKTTIDEQLMFYQFYKYKSKHEVVRKVDEHANQTIIFYYRELSSSSLWEPLCVNDNHVHLNIHNPCVHNSILKQAKVKLNMSDFYDPNYVIVSQLQEFKCEFTIPRQMAMEFVTYAYNQHKSNNGQKKVTTNKNQIPSSKIRHYIFNCKSHYCKNLFQPIIINKKQNDIYDEIESILNENVEALFIPSTDLKQAHVVKEFPDIRFNPRSAYLKQLLREMISCLDATYQDKIKGYLLLLSVSKESVLNTESQYNLHSLLAFKFTVPVDVLRRLRHEIICQVINKTKDNIEPTVLPLSDSALITINESNIKNKTDRKLPLIKRHKYCKNVFKNNKKTKKRAMGVQFINEDDDD